jgi:hypothetical protein
MAPTTMPLFTLLYIMSFYHTIYIIWYLISTVLILRLHVTAKVDLGLAPASFKEVIIAVAARSWGLPTVLYLSMNLKLRNIMFLNV